VVPTTFSSRACFAIIGGIILCAHGRADILQITYFTYLTYFVVAPAGSKALMFSA
jgi:hypothetical protein